jgi:hypothetical protein
MDSTRIHDHDDTLAAHYSGLERLEAPHGTPHRTAATTAWSSSAIWSRTWRPAKRWRSSSLFPAGAAPPTPACPDSLCSYHQRGRHQIARPVALFNHYFKERNMTERTERVMRELLEEEGVSEEVARLRMRDEDLWVLRPGARFDEDLTGEEGVRLWEEAAQVAQTVADAISNGPGSIQASPAVTMLVWDVAARAEEALARAVRRRQREEVGR